MSEVVGNYEKLRLQDQQAIQKLKERLQKLDVENATLTRQISTDENRTPDNERDLLEDETPEELKKQVFKLKGLLKIAMDSSDKPLDLGTNIYYFDLYATFKLNDVLLQELCLQIKWSGFEPWPGTLCCVLGQDTLLSQCLSPPRCINGYRRI